MDTAEPPPEYFAPELFASHNDAPLAQDTLPAMAQDIDMGMEDAKPVEFSNDLNNDSAAGEELPVKQEAIETAYPPLDDETMPAAADSSILDMVEETVPTEDGSLKMTDDANAKARKYPGKRAKVDPNRSSIHSSKNEGQHTDRRYLCYLCNKLFTRRRSVRDHISKIHNTKTWEPVRSLEVIVDPTSGEPLEPLDDVIARGPPPPPPKLSKAEKALQVEKRREEGGPQEEEENVEEEGDVDAERAPQPSEQSPAPAIIISSLKQEPSVAGSRLSSVEPFAVPAPVVGKKRPAPEDSPQPLSAAAKKKGTAKIKSSATSNKRTKLSESEQSPPSGRLAFRSPSATPASTQLKPIPSKLKKQTSAASVTSSPTPASSRAVSVDVASPSTSTADTPTSSNDDGEVFCICRKGDNHTWMIACDGGCDEWFHGNCVNIKERDGELIDKYICPTCTKPGLQTTWKRRCRRKDCRKPARVMQDPPSKYCSDACGRMFFVDLVQRSDPKAQASRDGQYILEAARSKKQRKKHKRREERTKAPKPLQHLASADLGDLINPDSRLATPAYSEEDKTEYETDSSLDDELLPNRGAALRAGEIKALLDKCKEVEEWKALGRKPDTPPSDGTTADIKPVTPDFDDLETAKMSSIEEEKRRLNARNDVLTARETFLGLVKTRSASIVDEVRKSHPKMKDLCGFDPRMAWSDEEFLTWYTDQGGKEIIDAGADAKIGPPEDVDDTSRKPNGVNGVNHNSDSEGDETDSMPKKGGVCIKNRCPRHRNWAKGQLAELRFEQDLVRRSLSRCEAQESEIRDRAVVRSWENRG